MDFKSPLAKKQKLQSSTYDDIREINNVMQLRRNVGEIIDHVYSAETNQLLKCLARIEVELNNSETYTIPDVEDILKSSERLSKQDQTIKKNSNHLILLNMLENKNSCPIAKIIDQI